MAAGYEIPVLRFSGEAGEAITRRRFVQPSTTDDEYVMADAGEIAVGVSYNDPADGETLEIVTGIVIVEAGELITRGTEVECGTNGVAVAHVSGIAQGVAITGAGASGELISVKTYY